MIPELEAALAARRARAAKVEAADIARTRERILNAAKRLGVVAEETTVDDVLAAPMPTVQTTVIEPWSEPLDPEEMTAGEAFVAWNASEQSHTDLRKRAAGDEL